MRLFGILLIVANLLAGGAFVYFATQDWKGRQTINAAGLRHLLLLQGLPLEPAAGASSDPDEIPFVVELGGGESTKTISKKLLESYFQANTAAAPAAPAASDPTAPARPLTVSLTTGATAVADQIAEVKRVQALIKAELAKDSIPTETKIALLKGWLLLQAETPELRNTYLALIAPTDANGAAKGADQVRADTAKLEELLDARFTAVINKPQVSDGPASAADAATADREKLDKSAAWKAGGTLDETERRMRLAHLLVHLDPDPVWQKRVSVVVGLRRYVKAIAAQVGRFKDMIAAVEIHIPGDQATFIKHETQLREQATQSAERARVIAEERAKLVEQKTKDDDAVSRQRTQLKELSDQLAKIKAEVDELLVRQSGIEKQLFEVQRVVGLTLEEVYRLEELLTDIERERFGLPPRPKP
jgi:hypothetical protein